MADPGVRRLLQEAHGHVIVLGPVKLGSEASEFLHNGGPVGRKVVRIHHGPEEVRGPVGLEERVVAEGPVLRQLVLIGIEEVRVRMLMEVGRKLPKGVRTHDVVAVGKYNEVSACGIDAVVCRPGNPPVFFPVNDPDMLFPLIGREHFLHLRIRRMVVDENQFKVPVGLPQAGVDAGPKLVLRAVIDRNHDGEADIFLHFSFIENIGFNLPDIVAVIIFQMFVIGMGLFKLRALPGSFHAELLCHADEVPGTAV